MLIEIQDIMVNQGKSRKHVSSQQFGMGKILMSKGKEKGKQGRKQTY